ncbi:MAG TPA: HlyD family efflux transporter periplasmic adaptor subunit [Gammaproteobacteria bacterium]|nr:HlyD family efflux transporter periplasmic adaptor subunit [Gammaproteobacteria bacterium]
MRTTSRHIRIILPPALLALALAGAYALYATHPQSAARQVEERAWRVSVEPLRIASLAPTLTLYGQVESPRAARLKSALAAEVVALSAREGRAVNRGEVLLRLDERDRRLALRRREAEVREIAAQLDSERRRAARDRAALERERALLELARQSLARSRDLAARQLASDAAVDEAQSAVERQALAVQLREAELADAPTRLKALQARLRRAEAEREQAALDLSRAVVKAPFPAVVSRVEVAVGDRVAVGTPLVRLFDPEALEIRAQIPADRLGAVRAALAAGRPLRATLAADGAPRTAVLDRLAAEVDPQSGGVDGLFRFTASAPALPLGQFVDLLLELPPQAGVAAIPPQALHGLERVYVLREGRMRGVDVSLVGERRVGGKTRLLVRGAGLRSGDRLITTPLPNAIDGLKVTTGP